MLIAQRSQILRHPWMDISRMVHRTIGGRANCFSIHFDCNMGIANTFFLWGGRWRRHRYHRRRRRFGIFCFSQTYSYFLVFVCFLCFKFYPIRVHWMPSNRRALLYVSHIWELALFSPLLSSFSFWWNIFNIHVHCTHINFWIEKKAHNTTQQQPCVPFVVLAFKLTLYSIENWLEIRQSIVYFKFIVMDDCFFCSRRRHCCCCCRGCCCCYFSSRFFRWNSANFGQSVSTRWLSIAYHLHVKMCDCISVRCVCMFVRLVILWLAYAKCTHTHIY